MAPGFPYLRLMTSHIVTGNAIGGECQAEMLDHRRQLLEDYRLSPEVVFSCQEDIKTNCRTKYVKPLFPRTFFSSNLIVVPGKSVEKLFIV